MKTTSITIFIFLCSNLLFGNELLKHIDAVKYGQNYCIRNEEGKDIQDFLKKHAEYAYNECKHEKYNDKDFDSLKKLAEKDPKKYGFYLGMSYYLGWTPKHKENNAKAKQWFMKSGVLGNSLSQIKYCNITDTKVSREKCYSKLDSPESYFARAVYLYGNNQLKKYENIKKSSLEGYIEAYPAYISYEMNVNAEFKFSQEVNNNLKNIIVNPKTSFSTKMISVQILGSENYLKILDSLLQTSNFKYHE